MKKIILLLTLLIFISLATGQESILRETPFSDDFPHSFQIKLWNGRWWVDNTSGDKGEWITIKTNTFGELKWIAKYKTLRFNGDFTCDRKSRGFYNSEFYDGGRVTGWGKVMRIQLAMDISKHTFVGYLQYWVDGDKNHPELGMWFTLYLSGSQNRSKR